MQILKIIFEILMAFLLPLVVIGIVAFFAILSNNDTEKGHANSICPGCGKPLAYRPDVKPYAYQRINGKKYCDACYENHKNEKHEKIEIKPEKEIETNESFCEAHGYILHGTSSDAINIEPQNEESMRDWRSYFTEEQLQTEKSRYLNQKIIQICGWFHYEIFYDTEEKIFFEIDLDGNSHEGFDAYCSRLTKKEAIEKTMRYEHDYARNALEDCKRGIVPKVVIIDLLEEAPENTDYTLSREFVYKNYGGWVNRVYDT